MNMWDNSTASAVHTIILIPAHIAFEPYVTLLTYNS